MKIAIPTNDRSTVAERSGRAAEFAIVEIDDNNILSTTFIENEHEKTHHSGEGHSHGEHADHGHGDLVELLEGVSVIIGKKFGPHFSRDFHNAGVKMKLTKLTKIDDVINEQVKTNSK
jgi:predicted Fe-Mo cluster-binding NifX family protein